MQLEHLGEWVVVALAWTIGFACAWIARGWSNVRSTTVPLLLQSEEGSIPLGLARESVAEARHPTAVVEGIGKGYQRRLELLGVADTVALLNQASTRPGRQRLAEELKVEPLVIRRWASMADLLRVPSLDGQSAEVLEAAGVESLSQLVDQDPVVLATSLESVNQRLRLTPGAVPQAEQLAHWITMAEALPVGPLRR